MIFLYAAKVREQRVEQRLLVDGSTEHIVETGAASELYTCEFGVRRVSSATAPGSALPSGSGS